MWENEVESLTVQSKCRKIGRIAPTKCEAIRYRDLQFLSLVSCTKSSFWHILLLYFGSRVRVRPYAIAIKSDVLGTGRMQQGIMLEPEPAARPPLPRTRFKLQRNAKCTVLERHSKQLVPSFSPLRRCSPIDTWIIHCKRFSNKTVDTKDWANWDFIVPLQNHRLVLISCLTPIPSPKTPRHQWPKALTSPKKNKILPCSPQLS